jgi:hypothetical protein
MNKGTLDAHLPARIYVDDALLLGLSRRQMELKLAALIEAIFVIMGTPDTSVRQCPLAMDKWLDLVVAPKQRMLGLIIDTNRLVYCQTTLQKSSTYLIPHGILTVVVSPSGKHKSLQENWAI